MAITLRSVKGSELTHNELDANFTTLRDQVSVVSGTALAPSIAFSTDSTTGFYRAAASSIGVALGGANYLTIATSGITSAVPLYFKDTNEIIRNISGTNTLEVAALTDRLVLSGATYVNIPANSRFDGTNWNRNNTALTAYLVSAEYAAGFQVHYAAAGANPISWTTLESTTNTTKTLYTRLAIESTIPRIDFYDPDAALDEKYFRFRSDAGILHFDLMSDAGATNDWLTVDRVAHTAATVQFPLNKVGIGGATPYQHGNTPVLSVGGAWIFDRGNNEFNATNNAYYDGAYRYRITGNATVLALMSNAGDFYIYTAPSGTAGNAITFTERFSINNTGTAQFTSNVGIGAASSSTNLAIQKLPGVSAGESHSIEIYHPFDTGVNVRASVFSSRVYTQAVAHTIPTLLHFNAQPVAFGAGSTVTNQYGFFASSALTGATSNYGFYGEIAAGANRWNFYAGGTAPNYFAGDVTMMGAIKFGTYAASALSVTGYITISDSSGTPRRLLVG